MKSDRMRGSLAALPVRPGPMRRRTEQNGEDWCGVLAGPATEADPTPDLFRLRRHETGWPRSW